MAVMFKKPHTVAENILGGTFKISPALLKKLKDTNSTLSVGNNSLSLSSPSGHTSEYCFNTLTNNIVKNPTPEHIVKVNAFVAEFLNSLSTSVPTPVAASPKFPSKPKIATKPVFDMSALNNMIPVKLREATQMYQKVFGTSGGSVYRLVAYNDQIKVAVRINGDSLSMRVEGDFNNDIINRFEALGVNKKNDAYMSGHFSCENSTPDRAVGAILTGVGLEFDSPMPNLAKIK